LSSLFANFSISLLACFIKAAKVFWSNRDRRAEVPAAQLAADSEGWRFHQKHC